MADPTKLSVLGQLAKRVEEVKAARFVDLPVPGWEPPVFPGKIFVRYLPIDNKEMGKLSSAIERAKKADRFTASVDAACDLLIRSCDAVFALLDGDDTRYSLRADDWAGEPTKFDQDLAANLGLDEGATARQVVRKLYTTDGDILSACQAVQDLSGYHEADAEQIAGE